MANIANFDMKFKSKNREAFDSLYELVKDPHSIDVGKDSLPGADVHYSYEGIEGDEFHGYANGSCRWSVKSSFADRLAELSKLHPELTIEVISRETDLGFSEHWLFASGNLYLDDVGPYVEIWINDEEDWEEVQHLLPGREFSEMEGEVVVAEYASWFKRTGDEVVPDFEFFEES